MGVVLIAIVILQAVTLAVVLLQNGALRELAELVRFLIGGADRRR